VQARAGSPFCGVLDALGPPCLTANVRGGCQHPMITNSDIIDIFRAHVPIGTPMPVREIHGIVERAWLLSPEDWAPHPSEERRNHTYPSWKRKVQAALHTLKLAGKIRHLPDARKYVFAESSCR
jgi:hypothetical protein